MCSVFVAAVAAAAASVHGSNPVELNPMCSVRMFELHI